MWNCNEFSDLRAEFIFPLLKQNSVSLKAVSLQAKSSWLLRDTDKQVTLCAAKLFGG